MKNGFGIVCLLMGSLTFISVNASANACLKANKKAKTNDIASLIEVEKTCSKLVEPTCRYEMAKFDGLSGSDFDLVMMGCALRTAYVANLTIGNGKASSACQKAIIHIYTASTLVAEGSAQTCMAENNRICETQKSDLEKAQCKAEVAYASYMEARNKPGLKLDPEIEKAAQEESQREYQEFLKALEEDDSEN